MGGIPTIETKRLTLRPFTLADAKEVQRLAGDWEVASTTLEIIPHPYEDGMAEEWIKTHQDDYAKGEKVTLAITHRDMVISSAPSTLPETNDSKARIWGTGWAGNTGTTTIAPRHRVPCSNTALRF